MLLACGACSFLYKPLMLRRVKPKADTRQTSDLNDNQSESISDIQSTNSSGSEQQQVHFTTATTTWEIMKETGSEMLGPEILFHYDFIFFATAMFLASLDFMTPYLYTMDRALELGLADEVKASRLISVKGLGSTLWLHI